MALIAAHLNAGVILVVTVYRYVYNLPLPNLHTLPPRPPHLSPSQISLVVSVDVSPMFTYLLHIVACFMCVR